MAVTLIGADGFFTRLGKIGHVLSISDTFFASSASGSLQAEVNDIMEEIDGASNEIRAAYSLIPDALDVFVTSPDTFYADLQTSAQELLIQMVDDDDPLPTKDVPTALTRLIEQMVASSDDVDANEPTIASAAASPNTGAATVITSLVAGDGTTMENVFDEDIELIVTTATTERGESYTITGEESRAGSVLSVYWPSGSASSTTGTVIDPSADGVLTNGDFETFTVADTPDSWTIEVGAVATEIFEESTNVYLGSKCLQFTGTATLTELTQDLSTKGLTAHTPYICHIATKVSSSPAAGTLLIQLWDGSAVIADEAGTNNQISIDLTATSTANFDIDTAVFRLPDPPPATIELRIKLSVALSAGSDLFIDSLCFGVEPVQCYDAGPYVAMVGQSTASRLATGDKYTVTVTNDYRGAMQQLSARLFEQPALQLPSDTGGTETVADSLIG